MGTVKEFLKMAEKDANLCERLREATTAEGGMDGILALAREYGFTFTPKEYEEGVYADLREAAIADAKSRAENGALSDEELDKVSGGSGLVEYCREHPTRNGCLFLRPVRRGEDTPRPAIPDNW